MTPREEAEAELAAFGRARGGPVIRWIKQELMSPPSLGWGGCALKQDAGRRNCLADLLRMLESETPVAGPDHPDPKLPDPGKPVGRTGPRGSRRRGQSGTGPA